MKTEEFDEKFESGEDTLPYLDVDNARKPNQELKRVNVDFPVWVIDKLDSEAREIGISRQALIKTWIVDRIKNQHS